MKLAREEGWSNTSRGLSRLKSVEHEIELALSLDQDLSEIREAVMVLVDQAESIAPEATEPFSLIEKADSERALGAARRGRRRRGDAAPRGRRGFTIAYAVIASAAILNLLALVTALL